MTVKTAHGYLLVIELALLQTGVFQMAQALMMTLHYRNKL
jgi:hypothetical protein